MKTYFRASCSSSTSLLIGRLFEELVLSGTFCVSDVPAFSVFPLNRFLKRENVNENIKIYYIERYLTESSELRTTKMHLKSVVFLLAFRRFSEVVAELVGLVAGLVAGLVQPKNSTMQLIEFATMSIH